MNSIQEKLNQAGQLYDYFQTLADETAKVHNKIAVEFGYGHSHFMHEGTIASIDEYGITIKWTYYGPCGYYDEGTYELSEKMLNPNTQQQAFIKKFQDIKTAKQAEESNKREREIELLEKLQHKYQPI